MRGPQCEDARACEVVAVCRSLIGTFHLENCLKDLVSILVKSMRGVDAGILLLYDQSRDSLIPTSAHGYEFEKIEEIRLGDGESEIGRVFESGEVAIYGHEDLAESLKAAKGSMEEVPYEGRARTARFAIMPLVFDGVTVGCLLLENRKGDGASMDGLSEPFNRDFLRIIAEILALYIHGYQLLRRSQEKRLSELASLLSHELRTPLTCIKGYATALLREDTTWSPDTMRQFLEAIDSEANAMNDLIGSLMKSSMIEAGFLRIKKQPVLLERVARKAVEHASLRTQRHRFFVKFTQQFPVVEADPERIRQVFDNLLDNAIKYSPNGGLIVVQGRVRRKEVVISVADQGIGIGPESLNRLFEKFYRVKSDLGGMGLGLPVAREIVERHGGRIWAQSIPGKGSTFYFTLPLTKIGEPDGD
ncbi:MAG TPA: GAF domain-containing protein [Clostridia bacterium]|nr:GAF domain-containing protein [Clostridia bacterium]